MPQNQPPMPGNAYASILIHSGMSGISGEIYDAASIDGANARQQLFRITLPLLRPTTFFLVVTSFISAMQVFDIVSVMTGGGPYGSTLVMNLYIYQTAFVKAKAGYASALSALLFIMVLAVTVAQRKFSAKWAGMSERKKTGGYAMRRLGRVLTWIFLAVTALIVTAPFLWMLITSFQPDIAAVLARPFRLPWPPALGNYVEAWKSAPFGIYTFNSAITALAATLLQCLNAILCAYAFTNLRFPGRNFLFTLVLVVLMIPSQVAVVPSYAVISWLGWLNSYKALIIPFAVDAFGVFLIRQTFLSIPRDYVEAARIEGAGHLRIAFSILGRMAGPSVAAFAIMAFKWRWNDYFWVLLMTTSDKMRTCP